LPTFNRANYDFMPPVPETSLIQRIAITIIVLLIGFGCLHPQDSPAQTRPSFLSEDADWLWPTNASRYMSSSFGETRAAHFHAAMDIGTWGHEGYAVFASRDGIVQRVGVSPFGYGNVIYLRHADGTISIYAHLKDFHPRIRSVVDSLRLKDYTADFDRNMEEFDIRFQRGQQIGWTGSTGVGPPHLHFELRTPEGRPFNPKLAGVRINDTIPPQFSGLAVEPLSRNSLVNGSGQIHRVRPARRSGFYDFGTLSISGEVGLAVNAFDRANASNNVHAVYELKMYVDDELYFHSRADSFAYGQARQMFIDRVFPILRNERRGYQRLYVRTANTLPFYRDTGHSGRLDLPPGEYTVRIIASDFYGNRSSARVRLTVTEAEDTGLVAKLRFPEGYADGRIVTDPGMRRDWSLAAPLSGRDASNDRNPSSQADMSEQTVSGRDLEPDERDYMLNGGMADEFHNKTGLTSRVPAFFPDHPPETLLWHKNWVRAGHVASGAAGQSEISIRPLGSFSDEMRTYASATAGLPLDIADRIELRKGDHAWILHRIRPENPVTIYHDGMRIAIQFPLNAFFEPLSIGIAGSYPEFSVFPDIEPFRRPATVRILLDEGHRSRNGIGLYRINPNNGRLSHVPSQTNKAGNRLTGTISAAGRYTIAFDTLAPEVKNPAIGRWRHVNRYYATVDVDDELSGVDYRTAVFHVNGLRGIAEYDPEKKLLRFHHPEFRPQRVNEISVTVSDNAGNTVQRTFTGVRYN
jgi:hypothetical protein